MRYPTSLGLVIMAALCGPAAVGDVVSFGAERQGVTWNASNGPVYATAPHSPMYLYRNDYGTFTRGFMAFDLAVIPSGATITSVRFEFPEHNTGGNPTIEIWGGYEDGELAYDTYFDFASGQGAQVYQDFSPFTSMTTDGAVFGSVALSGQPDPLGVSVNLASNGALSYFQSQIGNELLLFTRLANDLVWPGGAHGMDNGSFPTLRIEYETLVVPSPSASVLAFIDLGASMVARRRMLT